MSTFSEEYYSEEKIQKNSEQFQAEHEAYLEEFRQADEEAEQYWSKHIGFHSFQTIKDAFKEGFISGWMNKKC